MLGIAFAMTLTNPYAATSSRFVTPLLQISVVGLGAGMNLGAVAHAGMHGFLYTAIGVSLTMTIGLILGRSLGTARNTSLLVTVGTAICGGERDRCGSSRDSGKESRSFGGLGDGVFSERNRALHLSLDRPLLRSQSKSVWHLERDRDPRYEFGSRRGDAIRCSIT